MSFQDMKRNASNFDKLSKELSKINTSGRPDNDQYWTCSRDKSGNGYAIIRFLPAPGDEEIPFVRLWNHAFQGPGGWFIENSRTTIGEADPVSEYNTKLWNSGNESDKEIARKQKRKLNYIANIYVVKDPSNPDNEGKVFLYKFGKKIFDKLNELMHPPEDPLDPKTPINPFDLWNGANFKLKVRNVDNYPNYDKSEFDTPGPLLDDDDQMEEIWKSEYSLKELVEPKNFKSYDELKTKFERVIGLTGGPGTASRSTPQNESAWSRSDNEIDVPSFKSASAPSLPSVADDSEEDDEWMKKLKNMSLDD